MRFHGVSLVTLVVFLLLSAAMVTTGFAQDATGLLTDGQCIKSFGTFAFNISDEEFVVGAISSPKWQLEAVIPTRGFEDDLFDEYHNMNVSLTRLFDGNHEIWVTGKSWTQDFEIERVVIIYNEQIQAWRFVSPRIGNTDFYVTNLYVDSKGNVWGKIVYEPSNIEGVKRTLPAIGKFDEVTQQFAFAEGVLEIPLAQQTDAPQYVEASNDQVRILLDKQDVFWIFVQNDGLYRYDPTAQSVEKRAEFADAYIGSTTLALDGSLYFTKATNKATGFSTARELYTLPEGILFQFFPNTNVVLSIDTPNVGWPTFSGFLVDHQGQLWLGSVGYRELDGTWHLIHPNPEEFFSHAGDYTWTLPSLILESSDGILWFKKYLDTNGPHEGTAWYDPATGAGCMFTNIVASIIEDAEHRLWLLADEKLYKYIISDG